MSNSNGNDNGNGNSNEQIPTPEEYREFLEKINQVTSLEDMYQLIHGHRAQDLSHEHFTQLREMYMGGAIAMFQILKRNPALWEKLHAEVVNYSKGKIFQELDGVLKEVLGKRW